MIVTLTANPSLDRAVELAAPLQPGAVQAARSLREDPGGKGVNVARVLAAAGDDVRAVLPLAAADPYRATLGDLPIVAVDAEEDARSNLTITDPDGVTTKLNLPGPTLTAATADALVDAVVRASEGARWLALCGSLPPGTDDDFYVRVIREVRARLADPPLVAVDASGGALAAVVSGARPDLITPNETELAELAGVDPQEFADADAATGDAIPPIARSVARVARLIVPSRAGAVLVTLGGAGAVLVDATGATHATTPTGIRVRSTVGAGDSALAGYLHAHVTGATGELLVSAVRHGSATASLPGTRLATPHDLPGGAIAANRIP